MSLSSLVNARQRLTLLSCLILVTVCQPNPTCTSVCDSNRDFVCLELLRAFLDHRDCSHHLATSVLSCLLSFNLISSQLASRLISSAHTAATRPISSWIRVRSIPWQIKFAGAQRITRSGGPTALFNRRKASGFLDRAPIKRAKGVLVTSLFFRVLRSLLLALA